MMLKEIFKNRTLIWEGIRNSLFRQEHIEAIYEDRREICDGCDEKDIEGSKCAVPGTKPCCSLCGCSLSLKLRSLSSDCPFRSDEFPNGKWQGITTKQEEDMIHQQILNHRLNDTKD